MNSKTSTNPKIINDPVHGFITIKNPLILELIDNPYLQRLRRISQLGLASLVYPGALHTRFQHTLGAIHLMQIALNTLRAKGTEISEQEYQDAVMAIMFHDIGHGPFSHNLENVFFDNISHENISLFFIDKLNKQYNNSFKGVLDIFSNNSIRPFLHQLVSGQLDMDRLDYIKRDSYFTGVSEGHINTERIINMINTSDDKLVVDLKGIYSIEKFIVARRLMYWQVYYHKTVLASQIMLFNIFKRVKYLLRNGENIELKDASKFFLKNKIDYNYLSENTDECLNLFSQLDDNDVYCGIKKWANSKDPILSELSKSLLNRKLYRVDIFTDNYDSRIKEEIIEKIKTKRSISDDDLIYYMGIESISNKAYNHNETEIFIIDKKKKVSEISEHSDILNISLYSHRIMKKYFYYPKWLTD